MRNGEKRIIDGYKVTMYYHPEKRDTVLYYTPYGECREAAIRFCKWVLRLHGNAPSGTKYGSVRIILPNGRRVSEPLYV